MGSIPDVRTFVRQPDDVSEKIGRIEEYEKRTKNTKKEDTKTRRHEEDTKEPWKCICGEKEEPEKIGNAEKSEKQENT